MDLVNGVRVCFGHGDRVMVMHVSDVIIIVLISPQP